MKFKPHHVAFTVKNLKETISWYTEKLGFRLLDHYDKNHMHIARIQLDEVVLELFHFTHKTEPLPSYRKSLMNDLNVIGTKHLCIEVDDLDKTVQALKTKNVTIVANMDTTYFGGKFIFIKDCNGILLELFER